MSISYTETILSIVHIYCSMSCYSRTFKDLDRDVTEPANIRIRRMRISCAKSVGFGCGCGFVVRSKLPAIMVTVIQLSYLKLSSCNWTSSEQL